MRLFWRNRKYEPASQIFRRRQEEETMRLFQRNSNGKGDAGLRRRLGQETPSVLVAEVGIILIRAFPQDSHMTLFDIDPHLVPSILRALADSYEAEHCPDGTMAEHEHEEMVD